MELRKQKKVYGLQEEGCRGEWMDRKMERAACVETEL